MSATQELAPISATETQSFDEYEAVVKALTPYITSAKTGEGDVARSAFYDHARIVGSINGEVATMDPDSYAAAVEGNESPDVRHRIAWIDISGPAAAAKVEFIDWVGFRFTDFFVLFKQDGEWKISSKVFDSHDKN